MNVTELAKVLDIPTMTLYSLIQNGVIWSYTKTNARRTQYIFNEKDVNVAIMAMDMLELGFPRKLIAEVTTILSTRKSFIRNGIEIRRAK
jgi:hypothetical protein